MNILQVSPFFPPAWAYGGPSRVVFELSQNLAKAGHEVTVYTTDARDSATRVAQDEDSEGEVRVRRFRNLSNYLAWYHKFFIAPGIIPAARNELAQFDIIHLHGSRNLLNAVISSYAKENSKPVILQAHGSLETGFGRTGLKKLYDVMGGRGFFESMAGAIALNRSEAGVYQEFGFSPEKVIIIPNAIVLQGHENSEVGVSFRRTFGVPEDTRLILYLGRLHHTKRIDLLLRAFERLSRSHDDLLLALVGPDDGYETRLRNLVSRLSLEDSTLITGFVSHDLRQSALRQSEVLVTPSFRGFPITFLESLDAGTPIITTTNADHLGWLHENVGYVVPFDAKDLAEAILRILSDKAARLRFGVNGKRLVSREFNWGRVLRKYEAFYEDSL